MRLMNASGRSSETLLNNIVTSATGDTKLLQGKAGYELPELVFWNVEARDTHLPVTQNEKGVKLVSGASANIFADVVSGDLKVVTPYDFMLKILEPYS